MEPPPPAAVAGPDTLSTEVLAGWMVLGQPLPVSEEVAEGLATHWAEMTALALLGSDELRSPDFVDAVVWPEVQGAVLDSVLSSRLPPPAPLSASDVEETYRDGRLRLVARVLRRVSPEAHPEERQRQRDEAFDIHRRLVGGMSWNEAVARSEDEATRGSGGLLGLVGPGEMEAGLERAAYGLEPGAISPVVETRSGYQVLFRPRLDDVRDLFRDGLMERLALRGRAALMDSLVAERSPVAGEDAGARLLQLAQDGAVGGAASGGSATPLVRWDGGALSDTAAARYLTTLSTSDLERLSTGPEVDADDLVVEIARQELLWQTLVSADDSQAQEWTRGAATVARGRWLAELQPIEVALGLDGGGDPDARRRTLVAYMESVVARRQAPLPAPAAVIGRATRAVGVEVDPGGLRSAVERAGRLIEGAGG